MPGVVGGFPGLQAGRRRTNRAPVNPMDKSTIFSIYPKAVHEVHCTVQPGVFDILPGSVDKPTLLVVGSSSWWKELDDEQPLLEIPNGSVQVADAIVKSYCSGLVAVNMQDSMPGLFWVPGEFNIDNLRTDKKLIKAFESAKLKQNNWYDAIIKITNSLWARTNGNPLVVSDEARLAAKERKMDDVDWMKSFTMVNRVPCVACGTPRDSKFPVCSVCRHVDMKMAKELGLVFATTDVPAGNLSATK